MPSWMHSLQFRLVVGFASVLALALAGVSAYSAFATQREIDQFEREVAAARASRLESMVARAYDVRAGLAALQPTLEQAGELFDWRIVIEDPQGIVVADSHRVPRVSLLPAFGKMRRRPLVVSGREIGHLLFRTRDSLSTGADLSEILEDVAAPGRPAVEPPLSRLAASFNRSLVWAGLAAGGAGIVLIGMTTRRSLAGVRALTAASRALGQGDLSQRVPVATRDEVGELGRTFNDMASQLEGAEALRRTLTADIAHELRTPLSNLQGYLEAIRDGLVDPDANTIESLRSQVLHLSRLVEDLRMLALMEAGALPLEMADDRMEQIAALTVDSFQPRAAEKHISLTLDAPDGLPHVNVDRTRMQQVIGNLIDNAIIHTPEGGSVAVTVEPAAGRTLVVLSVSDTGPGIPRENLPHIFDRLYRVDPSRARATGGAGLGLTIVKQLVEAHGGRVSAESRPGEGSRLRVELPSAKA